VLELDDVLRDALADLISAGTQYGPVVDAHGRVAGVLSVEVISQVLRTSPDEARSSTELLTP
jgi:CBS-domain-containing membrane protein